MAVAVHQTENHHSRQYGGDSKRDGHAEHHGRPERHAWFLAVGGHFKSAFPVVAT
jgi:hypothetical protein